MSSLLRPPARLEKPRLVYNHELWSCYSNGYIGFGHTPKEAYNAWNRRRYTRFTEPNPLHKPWNWPRR